MKIICIGRNYRDHAKELHNPVPSEPVFFLKPDTALLRKGQPFYYPNYTSELHFEAEVVVRIEKMGKHIEPKFASKYYSQVTLGLDLTARDLQQELKTKGLPWEKAKGFDNSAPLGDPFLELGQAFDSGNIPFRLLKNQEVVQEGNTSDLIFSFDELIAYISKFITLKTGDLIFTGTPAGVGPLEVGDELKGFIGEEQLLQLSIK